MPAESQEKKENSKSLPFNFESILRAVENSTEVSITNAIGKIIHVNKKFCSITGYSEEELIGNSHKILNSGFHTNEFYKSLWETILSNNVWHGQVCNRKKNGNLYWINLTITPIREENELFFISIGNEITENKILASDLETSLSAYKKMLDNSPDIIARFDHDLRHTYVSPSVERFTGFKPEYFISKTNADLGMPEDLVRKWEEEMEKTFQGEVISNLEFEYPAPSGSKYFSARIVPEYDREKNIASILCITRDITEEKILEQKSLERKRLLNHIIDSIPGMCGYWDFNCINIFANKAYLEWFGKTPEEVIGIHIKDLLGEQLYQQNLPYIKKAIAGEVQQFERKIPRPDGTSKYTQAYYLPDKVDDKVLGFLVFVFDITKIKNAEQNALNANEFNKELLRVLFHDLKNPLFTLQLITELIELKPESYQTYKLEMIKYINNCIAIIDNVKDLQLTMDKKLSIQLKKVNLKKIINETIELFSKKICDKKLQIKKDLEETTEVIAEPISFKFSALANILSNAIKFSNAGSSIEIYAEESYDKVFLYLKDYGIGIPKNILDGIFDPLQTKSRRGTSGELGTGYGMSLVKKFTEAYGGEIEVFSEPNEGTLTKLTLMK